MRAEPAPRADAVDERHRYRVCGLTLSSATPIAELVPATAGEIDAGRLVRFEMRRPARGPQAEPRWFLSYRTASGAIDLACAHESGGFRLRFPGLADFRVSADGCEIVCEPRRGIPDFTLRHLLLDHVIPRALGLMGEEALHATAVVTPHGVCAFTGPSGAGKSTLAAAFHLAGHSVISDDCLVLHASEGGVYAVPAYPGVRLWDDSAAALIGREGAGRPVSHDTSKRRVLGERGTHAVFSGRSLPLACIYELDSESEPGAVEHASIGPTTPREAFMLLVRSIYRLDLNSRTMLERQFDLIDRLVKGVAIRRLYVPEDYARLGEACDAVLENLARSAAPGKQAVPVAR